MDSTALLTANAHNLEQGIRLPFLVLAFHADEDGRVEIPKSQLARDCGLTSSAGLHAKLERLSGAGVVDWPIKGRSSKLIECRLALLSAAPAVAWDEEEVEA